MGNTYAEKWTLDRTCMALDQIDRYSRQDPDMLYIGQALEAVGTHQEAWKYWRRKWRKQYQVIDMMKVILQRFENRIFARMAKKEIPERVGMFALRHHYGWCVDRSHLPQEDDTYVDQELVRPPRPRAEEPPAAAELPQEEPPARAQPPRVEPPATTTPRRVSEENAAALRQSYNQRYPEAPLREPYPFYIGVPPAGAVVIRYGEGYFRKE